LKGLKPSRGGQEKRGLTGEGDSTKGIGKKGVGKKTQRKKGDRSESSLIFPFLPSRADIYAHTQKESGLEAQVTKHEKAEDTKGERVGERGSSRHCGSGPGSNYAANMLRQEEEPSGKGEV